MNRAFAGTLAAAALLHAGLIVLASRLPAFTATVAPKHPEEVSIELLEPPPQAVPEPRAAPAATAVAPAEPGQKVASYVAPRRAPSVVVAPPGASAELPAAPAPGQLPAPGGTGQGTAPHRPVNLGLGGDIYWMMRNDHPKLPDRVQPRRHGPRTAGALAEGLEARDRAHGHFRGGVVAAAAQKVANTLGPQQGHATFVVETDAKGHVLSVRMVGASADLRLWHKVAAGLRAELSRRAALRVPPGADGLRVCVLVEARVQLPSGSSPGGSVHFKGAGLGFDVADIGATPRRVVYARITSEVVL